MHVIPSGPRYNDEKAVTQFYRDVADRVMQLPGVVAEGEVSALPMTGIVGWGGIDVEGFTPAPGQELQADFRSASGSYFHTMQIPLLRGRFFSEHDTPDSARVAIVDERFARRFWPSGDAIGKHVWLDPKKPMTIVGVVAAVKQYG